VPSYTQQLNCACCQQPPPGGCCVPVISSVPEPAVACGNVYTYTPTLLDPDCDPPLTWTVVSGPGSFTGGTYNLTCGQPPCNVSVTIRVTNSCGNVSEQSFIPCFNP